MYKSPLKLKGTTEMGIAQLDEENIQRIGALVDCRSFEFYELLNMYLSFNIVACFLHHKILSHFYVKAERYFDLLKIPRTN